MRLTSNDAKLSKKMETILHLHGVGKMALLHGASLQYDTLHAEASQRIAELEEYIVKLNGQYESEINMQLIHHNNTVEEMQEKFQKEIHSMQSCHDNILKDTQETYENEVKTRSKELQDKTNEYLKIEDELQALLLNTKCDL